MRITQLGGQVQCQLEDGSVVTITTPPLTPSGDLTVESVRETLMALGEDVAKQIKKTGILQAHGFQGLRLHPDE